MEASRDPTKTLLRKGFPCFVAERPNFGDDKIIKWDRVGSSSLSKTRQVRVDGVNAFVARTAAQDVVDDELTCTLR